jgi:hypothetical protein
MPSDRAIKVAWVRAGLLACGAYYPSANDATIPRFCYKPEIRFVAVPDDFVVVPKQMKLKLKAEDVEPIIAPYDANTFEGSQDLDKTTIGVRMRVPIADNAFTAALGNDNVNDVQKMVKYLPILAHMAFTKFGHHYIDNDYFRESYKKQFTSLQLTQLESSWNHADIIYNAVHWMGPYAMRQWCDKLRTEKRMPRPLDIKFPLIPAGTALIASTVAVLKAAGALPGFSAYYVTMAEAWAACTQAVKAIKANPYQYHVRADLFGEQSREAELNVVKEYASQLAPCAQAFINKYAAQTDLARIKAIKKYADNAIGLTKRFEAIFAGAAAQTRAEARIKPLATLLAALPAVSSSASGAIVAVEDEEA